MEKVIMGTRLPAKLWLNEVEDSCMSQIMDLTSLPFAFKHIVHKIDAKLCSIPAKSGMKSVHSIGDINWQIGKKNIE